MLNFVLSTEANEPSDEAGKSIIYRSVALGSSTEMQVYLFLVVSVC